MIKIQSIALCLIAVGGFAQKGTTKMAADFFPTAWIYSCVSVHGANEQPAEFIKASRPQQGSSHEPMKYDVAGIHRIDILLDQCPNRPTRRWAAARRAVHAPQHEGRHRTQLSESSPATTTARETRTGVDTTTLDKGNGIWY